jgi:hypothetical protein
MLQDSVLRESDFANIKTDDDDDTNLLQTSLVSQRDKTPRRMPIPNLSRKHPIIDSRKQIFGFPICIGKN